MNSKKALLIAAISLAAGSIPPFAKLGLEVFDPFTLVFFRFAAASVVIFYFLPKEELSRKALARTKWIAIIGAFNPIFIFMALDHLPSNMTGLLYAIVPGLSVLYLLLIRHQRPSNIHLAGFLIGLVGVAVISQEQIVNDTEGNPWLGIGLASVAVIAFFIYGILSKEAQRDNQLSGTALAFYFSLVTTFVALPIALIESSSNSWWQALELKHLLAVLYLGFIGTGAQYLLFQKSLKIMEAAYANLFVYIQPIVAMVLAYFVVNETVSIQLAIGGFIALVGARLALSSPTARSK